MTAYKLFQLLVNGYRELTKRHLPWGGHRVWVAVGVALLASACGAPDITFGTERSGVEFVLSVKEDQTRKSALAQSLRLEDARSVLLSIKDSTGAFVYSNKQIRLDTFGGNHQSDLLHLLPGTYALEKFWVLNGNGQTLYAAPFEGSKEASAVKDPLEISFVISKDAVTQVRPEVVSTENRTPQDFGYAVFGFKVVEVLDFLVAVFVHDAVSQAPVLSPAQLAVENEHNQTLYHGNLQAHTTHITVPNGHAEYKVTITLPGYEPYVKTFTGTELATYFSSTREGPLKVVLRGLLRSCKELLAAGRSTGNGTYIIDPDGTTGAMAPQQVYCDMETNEGGWTAVDPRLASALGGTAVEALGAGTTTCQVGAGNQFEAYYPASFIIPNKLVCQYDIRIGFSFTELWVSDAPGNFLQFRSLAGQNHHLDIANLGNDWGDLGSQELRGDIGIGTRAHPSPVLSLGRALGLADGDVRLYAHDELITWPRTRPVTTTADEVLRIQYAESGSEREGVRWEAGRIFVR